MATTITIPLLSGAQFFGITLGDNDYNLRLVFRDAASGAAWYADMERTDGSDGIRGIPLVIGVDLLEQFKYKGFGHLYVTLDGARVDTPTYADMGSNITLSWSDDE